MSERLNTAAERLRERLNGSGFRGSVRFDMSDDGFLRVQNETVTTEEGEADCTIIGSMETFQEMFQGGLHPTSAFMTGKIRIEGDMSVAMRMAQLL